MERLRYVNKDYGGLAEVIADFLKKTDTSSADIRPACLGVAGIVEGRLCRSTNIAWTVDAGEVEEQRFGIGEVFLAKGRKRGLLESVPVYLIRDQNAALKGAPAYCRMKLAGS